MSGAGRGEEHRGRGRWTSGATTRDAASAMAPGFALRPSEICVALSALAGSQLSASAAAFPRLVVFR